MRYKAGKTDIINPGIASPEWEKAQPGKITDGPWSGFAPTPETEFRILRGPEGISVLMHTAEKDLKAECTEHNGSVYLDSCMEFFLKPDPWSIYYFNFEINPKGIAHIGFGKDRYGRQLIDTDRAVFDIESIPEDGNWTLKFYIPDSFLLRYVSTVASVCKANLYKCGDKGGKNHYGTWSPVETPAPDFHLPDFFGRIEL